MTTAATADVIAAVFRPGPKIQQPVLGGEWTEYQKLQAERKASKETVITVVASSSAQKQRRVGNPKIEAKVTEKLIAVH